MRARTAVVAAFLALMLADSPVQAGLRDDIAACAALVDDGARLACFDRLAADAVVAAPAVAAAAQAALKKEFRFDPGLMTGPLTFRLQVSGDLQISRPTAAAREVERVARRIKKAMADFDDWGLDVTVHGAQVTLSRGNPYTGAELLAQAQAGMARTGLPESRYAVSLGDDAEPDLWDDGRLRSANEHIIVKVTGLGEPLTR